MKTQLRYILFCLALYCASNSYAQNISINADGSAPDNSAMLDVSDTTKGILVPRLSVVQRNAITNPATGLLIFQTDNDSGFYFNQGTASLPVWVRLVTSANNVTELSDVDNDTKVRLDKTDDEDFIRFEIKGVEAMVVDTLGNIILGSSPPTSYQKVSISTDKLGANLRLNQESDSLAAEISFFNEDLFKWSIGSSSDAYQFGESFFLYNNDRGIMDLFVDGDNGNLGLGTTDPQGTLHLYGKGSNGAGSRIVFGDDYQSTTNQWNSFIGEAGWDSNTDTDVLQLHGRAGQIFTIGTMNGNPADTVFNIFSNGSVAVGNENLGQLFGINAEGSGNNLLRMRSDSGQIGLWFTNDSSNWALFSDVVGGSLIPQGSFGVYGGTTGGANEVRLVIDNEGKVGIGNNAPQEALQVGSFAESQDQFLSIKTAGGNQFKSGLKLLNFADDDGFTLVADEVQNKFLIQSHNGDTTDVFTIDRITNNVGIGTIAPRKELHVQGSIIAGSTNLASLPTGLNYALLTNNNGESLLSSSSGTKSELLKINGSTISFSSGTSNFSNPTVMFIDSSGQVGIGTNSPAVPLHVQGGTDASLASGSGFFLTGSEAGLNIVMDENEIEARNNGATSPLFLQNDGGNFVVGANKFYLEDGGNIGIGTTTPPKKLTLYDPTDPTLMLTSLNSAGFSNGANSGSIEFLETNTSLLSNGSGFRMSYNGSINKFFIESGTLGNIDTALTILRGSGFIGVRTQDPLGPLHVSTAGTTSQVPLILAGDAEIAYLDANDFEIVQVNNAGTITNRRFKISSAGNVEVNGSLVHSSDERLKFDIQPIDDVLTDLFKLKGVYYYWDTLNFPQRGYSSNRNIGFLAQDLQQVYPELVIEGEDGYLAVDYSKFTAVLLQAIKEQQQQIEALQAAQSNAKLQRIENEKLRLRIEKLENILIKD